MDQPPLRIEMNVNHPRERGRRVGVRNNAWIQQLIAITLRKHIIRALPVPKVEERGTAGKNGVPIGMRLVVFLDRVLEVAVEIDPVSGIEGAIRISETHGHFSSLLREHFGRLLQMHAVKTCVVDAEKRNYS